MRVSHRHARGEQDDDDEIAVGHVLGHVVVRDALEPTEGEWRAERKRLREELARKRPIGFGATWPA